MRIENIEIQKTVIERKLKATRNQTNFVHSEKKHKGRVYYYPYPLWTWTYLAGPTGVSLPGMKLTKKSLQRRKMRMKTKCGVSQRHQTRQETRNRIANRLHREKQRKYLEPGLAVQLKVKQTTISVCGICGHLQVTTNHEHVWKGLKGMSCGRPSERRAHPVFNPLKGLNTNPITSLIPTCWRATARSARNTLTYSEWRYTPKYTWEP